MIPNCPLGSPSLLDSRNGTVGIGANIAGLVGSPLSWSAILSPEPVDAASVAALIDAVTRRNDAHSTMFVVGVVALFLACSWRCARSGGGIGDVSPDNVIRNFATFSSSSTLACLAVIYFRLSQETFAGFFTTAMLFTYAANFKINEIYTPTLRPADDDVTISRWHTTFILAQHVFLTVVAFLLAPTLSFFVEPIKPRSLADVFTSGTLECPSRVERILNECALWMLVALQLHAYRTRVRNLKMSAATKFDVVWRGETIGEMEKNEKGQWIGAKKIVL